MGDVDLKTGTGAPRIKVLPPDVISKIAAGEVIERPASAVKELVENSLDAGATRVEVEVRGAPHVYLSVEDNGCGMTHEEMRVALERHSTSKISTESDLGNLVTLGFRGEALPSIAAVSRVELSSQVEGAAEGLMLGCEGGAVVSEERTAMSPGTRVEVRDLFYNLPARRKFLRSPETEMRHITRFVEACAIAHRGVFFRLIRDGAVQLSVPPSADLKDRVSSIHGPQLAGRLISLQDSSGGLEVEGLVGKPEATRSTRESMIFIINGRWVGSPLLARAVRDAYGDLLPAGRFPAAFVLLRLEPRLLDANVHPSKREVRFSAKVPVYDVVRGAAVAALSAHAPELWPVSEGEDAAGPAVAPAKQQMLGLGAGEGAFAGHPQGDHPAGGPRIGAKDFEKVMDAYRGSETATGESVAVNLWQLHGSYVVGQTKNGMVIIDQHAAHERILYEAARESMREGGGSSQQLLFPLVMDLSPSEYETLLEILPFLSKLGFDVRSMSQRSVAVYGIPALAREWRDGELLRDIIEEYEATGRPDEDRFEEVAKSFACHAAIKAGQPQTLDEMNALVDDLFATSVPHGDPHGRPTYLQISLSELERRFGRS
jgi:DNA mismatch repair protein MutL